MSMPLEITLLYLVIVIVIAGFDLYDMQSVSQQEPDGVDDGEGEADRHGDADPPSGETQNVRHIGLIHAADVYKVVYVLNTDNRQHDENCKLQHTDNVLNYCPCLRLEGVGDDINTKMGVLTVGIRAAYEHRPDEETGDDLVVPLERVVEEVAHDNVKVCNHNASRKGSAGDDSVKISQNFFESDFFLHTQ